MLVFKAKEKLLEITRTCFIMRLLRHFSVAHVVPGALVDHAASHQRTCVPLQLQLLDKESVGAARGGRDVGAIPDDKDGGCSG